MPHGLRGRVRRRSLVLLIVLHIYHALLYSSGGFCQRTCLTKKKSENYVILLTNVTTINLIKKKKGNLGLTDSAGLSTGTWGALQRAGRTVTGRSPRAGSTGAVASGNLGGLLCSLICGCHACSLRVLQGAPREACVPINESEAQGSTVTCPVCTATGGA